MYGEYTWKRRYHIFIFVYNLPCSHLFSFVLFCFVLYCFAQSLICRYFCYLILLISVVCLNIFFCFCFHWQQLLRFIGLYLFISFHSIFFLISCCLNFSEITFCMQSKNCLHTTVQLSLKVLINFPKISLYRYSYGHLELFHSKCSQEEHGMTMFTIKEPLNTSIRTVIIILYVFTQTYILHVFKILFQDLLTE